MVFTDPPYGVDYESSKGEKVAADDLVFDGLSELIQAVLGRALDFTDKQAAFYIWHASATRDDFAAAIKAAGLQELQYIIWAKPTPVLGWADYHWSHEPCFYACRSGKRPAFYGDRAGSTVWRVASGAPTRGVVLGPGVVVTDGQGGNLHLAPRPPKRKLRHYRVEPGQSLVITGEGPGDLWEVARDTDRLHPTQKPVELARRAILNSSREGEIVLDPFLGSGSTLVGAETTERRCFGVELDPRHVDVAVARWERLTESKAERG